MNIETLRDRLTPKQMKFALLLVQKGEKLTAKECALQAGYSSTQAVVEGSRLQKNQKVAAYIRELRNQEEKKYEVNLGRHLKRLHVLSEGAEESGNWNAAVQAEKSRGQVAGLYIDRKEIMHGSIDQLSRSEVDKLLTDMDKKLSITTSHEVIDDDQTGDEVLEKDKK